VAKENTRDYKGAEEAYHKSIRLSPDRAGHRFALGDFLQALGRYQEAAAFFRTAIELRPLDANTHFRLGQCLQALGERAGAAQAFRKALHHDPELSAARRGLEKLTAEQ